MEGKDKVMEGKDKAMQVLFTFLFVVQTIAAAELDPVEFLLSKDLPKNKSQVPLPENFKYSGTKYKTDCCSLVLFVTVKDWSPPTPDPDYYEEDSSEEPSEVKKPQIGHGVLDFTLSHPQIRDGDDIFSMNYVKNEEGRNEERFIINFNNCLNITDKIFGIYASTNIVDIKDIRIVIRNGKDEDVNCELTNNQGRTDTTGSGIPWHVVAIIGWVIAGILIVMYLRDKCFKLKKPNASSGQPEKAVPGGYTELDIEESGNMKGGRPRGGPRNTNLNGGDKTNVLCGPITKDNRIPLITGVFGVISLVFAIVATIMYFTSNDTHNQMANDVVQLANSTWPN